MAAFACSADSIDSVKSSAFVFLDTNALLLPYSVGARSLVEVERVFALLAQQNRLVVPGHVAREFAKNRPQKLVELYDQLVKRRPSPRPVQQYPLFEALHEFQEMVRLDKECDQAGEALRKAIDKVLAHISSWNWNDPVSQLYAKYITASVVADPVFDATELAKDFAFRCENQIPPGYKDKSKAANANGDYLIWRTVLEVVKETKRSSIFVSADEKADWWHRSAGIPLYPRHELQAEYRAASGDGSLFLMNLSRFLKLFDAPSDALEDVQVQEDIITAKWTGHKPYNFRPQQGAYETVSLNKIIKLNEINNIGHGSWIRVQFTAPAYRALSKVRCSGADASEIRAGLLFSYWGPDTNKSDATRRVRDVGPLRLTYWLEEPDWHDRGHGSGFSTPHVVVDDVEVIIADVSPPNSVTVAAVETRAGQVDS